MVEDLMETYDRQGGKSGHDSTPGGLPFPLLLSGLPALLLQHWWQIFLPFWGSDEPK